LCSDPHPNLEPVVLRVEPSHSAPPLREPFCWQQLQEYFLSSSTPLKIQVSASAVRVQCRALKFIGNFKFIFEVFELWNYFGFGGGERPPHPPHRCAWLDPALHIPLRAWLAGVNNSLATLGSQ